MSEQGDETMLVGVGEWGFRELPFEEHCRIARRFGFHYLELGIGGDFTGRLSREMSDSEVQAVRECVADYGLEAPFVCLENDFTLGDASELERMKARTQEELRLCERLGATHVRLFAGFAPAEEVTGERWSSMIGAFREADALCRELGMVIAIETHGLLVQQGGGFVHRHTTSTDWGCLQRLLAELPQRIGFNFDPGNLKAVDSRPLTEYAELLKSRINYCHLKDWKRQSGGEWIACGVGDDDIEWKPLLDATGFDGVHLIEYEPTGDVEDGIRRSLDHLRALFPDLTMKRKDGWET